jgi:hypothetical protein
MKNVTDYRTLTSQDARELTLLLQDAIDQGWHLFGIPTTQRRFDNQTGITTVNLTQALVKYDEADLKTAVQ